MQTRLGFGFLHFLLICLILQQIGFSQPQSSNDLELEEQEGIEEKTLNLTFRGDYYKAAVHFHKKAVVCYVGTWSTYRTPAEEGSFNIENIEPNLCTHLIYSFAGLDNTTFTMKPLDPWLDQKLEENGGGRDWYKRFTDLKKGHPHLHVLLAIGGWNEGSKKYSDMARNPKHRSVFVQSALDLIRKYDFDGLDLDWEFPSDRGGAPDDKRYFTVLVQELRSAFDKYGLLLTSAFGPAKSTADRGYELRELAGLLDNFHLMCYDYHGAWDKRTGHNAPLQEIQNSVDYYLEQGVPPQKLVVGIPFYGRTFLLQGRGLEGSGTNGNGLNETAADKGFQGPFTKEDGFLGYNEICKVLKGSRGDWRTFWDNRNKVPFMRNGDKWVSFENPDSIQEKINYIAGKGLKGVMTWSIDTDDFLSFCGPTKNPLLRTINYSLYRKKLEEDAILRTTTTTTKRPRLPTYSHASPTMPHNTSLSFNFVLFLYSIITVRALMF